MIDEKRSELYRYKDQASAEKAPMVVGEGEFNTRGIDDVAHKTRIAWSRNE